MSMSMSSPPPPPALDMVENKISPSILLIIVILAVIFFVSGLLHLLVRYLLRPSIMASTEEIGGADATALQGQLQQLFHLHDAGVDQAFIDALPVFPYRAIVGAVNDPFDCAVCLCEFEPDHRLRLLPKCSHAFHVDCIDTWLLTHSTCPLCRGTLLPADFSPSRCGSPILLLLLESASDSSGFDPPEHPAAKDDAESTAADETDITETRVIPVKLGNFRRSVVVSEGSSNLDQRRCFSMGTYEYVMNDMNPLCVAIKPPKKKQTGSSRRHAVSECDCHSRREFKGLAEESMGRISTSTKRESFSISKIWLRSKVDKPAAVASEGCSSRRAFSFRMPAAKPAGEKNGGNEMDLDLEAGSCNNSVASMEAQNVERVPSFARRTLLWIVGRQNRVGSMS